MSGGGMMGAAGRREWPDDGSGWTTGVAERLGPGQAER